ncbi:carbohydrate-binding family 9-like protein [Mucilaginibacter sp. SMC90]|uniref:carbohydrate-binding family 9-like protein n=1 Tax=Mucilaginibacter sp. SMC90 TaxID=2929803 RepID=UPI001FB1B816|nr:carbohydrate-binding family 9-like protein [Mucilaginibacter sp. SMC90]UOE48042.1 carbohydrate-binding family 9-like protein [Mucilaginibacter sp. SMC90]
MRSISTCFNRFIKPGITATLLILPGLVKAQDVFKEFPDLFTVPYSYVAKHVKQPPVIDGDVEDAVWQQAPWTKDFQDIEGRLKPQPPLQTNVKMLWDDSCLYVAARIKDPHVWAKLTRHDDIIYLDNDFELFIDPTNSTHKYFEIEVNALNTIFDLFLTKPYRNGGAAVTGWDTHGLRSAVKVQGTLNDPSDIDKGWTVEMAIPFKAITGGFNKSVIKDGTMWRINFSRVEYDTKVQNGKYVKLQDNNGRDLPEHNWVWSNQGLINMHFPERWGYLLFSSNEANDVKFEMPYAEQQKRYLWLVYYKQKQWFKDHHEYLPTLKGLGIDDKVTVAGNVNELKLEATTRQFVVAVTDTKTNITYTIDQDGLVQQLINP